MGSEMCIRDKSQWTTPTAEPKRFQTWIYAAPVVQDDAVTIDGGEIHDHQWMRVSDVVAAHKAGKMGMMPPTYVTLCSLLRYQSTADMIAGEAHITPPEVLPLFAKEGETFLVMFKGDAGYDNGQSTTPGARHRAVMQNGSWEYIYEGVSTDYPTFIPD